MEPISGHEPDRRDSDEGLIRRMLSGDEVALGILYDRYGGLVYSVAKHILGDSGAAEEVLQDIFHQLWRIASSFDSARGSLSGWLLVMARNRSIDRVRRRAPARGRGGRGRPCTGRRSTLRALRRRMRWRRAYARLYKLCQRRSAWPWSSLTSKDSPRVKSRSAPGIRWAQSRRG